MCFLCVFFVCFSFFCHMYFVVVFFVYFFVCYFMFCCCWLVVVECFHKKIGNISLGVKQFNI